MLFKNDLFCKFSNQVLLLWLTHREQIQSKSACLELPDSVRTEIWAILEFAVDLAVSVRSCVGPIRIQNQKL